MATKSTIEWTESTWNPVTGCSKISPGCKNCYAERMAKRLHAMGQPNYRNGFEVTTQPHALELPLTWKKPQTIFVNSMSDLFHEDVSEDFILKVFETMNKADWHRYQILTKRSDRMFAMNETLPHSEHIWLGVTVESVDYKNRIDDLIKMNCKIKFISCEPLLGSLGELNLKGIDWVIVGGESGPGARPIKEDWILEIKEQCDEQEVPFFFKQWGGVRKKKNGRELLNQTWDAMPEAIMV
jgi:protein gp37